MEGPAARRRRRQRREGGRGGRVLLDAPGLGGHRRGPGGTAGILRDFEGKVAVSRDGVRYCGLAVRGGDPTDTS